MGDENIKNQWNSSTSFILVMVGAIIGLAGIWRFSYLMYENGGGGFLIPYILAIVIMAIPLLVLEFGTGFKYKSSLPKIFYNIKPEFEIVAWFIVFLLFLILIYYTCIMSWDFIYMILALFKGWGSNPSVFFTTTLLHSTSSPYGLTYLVVPIGIVLILIWALIYFVSRKEINNGISIITKVSLTITFILIITLSIFALQLPGSRTGLMALFNPNWGYMLDFNVWLTAFGQLIFSYGLAYGIASTYSSYLPEDSKLVDSAWVIVLISLVFEILMSILIFALLGHMALGKNMPITSLVSDGFSLIFVVFPNVFNVMGSWVYIIGPAFFASLFLGGLGALFALIEPLANAVSEKLMWSKDRTVRTLVLTGLFASFLFATGMGEYLIGIVDSFINQFAIVLVVLLEVIVYGWLFDLKELRELLNSNSRIKLGNYWVYIIKFIIPVILAVVWIFGVYDLILTGDRQTLLIQSVLASIIVLVPLALTVLPLKGDFSSNSNNGGYNYFRGSGDNYSKSGHKSKSSGKSTVNGIVYVDKTIDDFKDNKDYVDESKDLDEGAEDSNNQSRFSWDRFKKSKNGKNVLNNVDLSSKEFDSPSDEEDYEDYYQTVNSLDDDYADADKNHDDFKTKVNDFRSRGDDSKNQSESDSTSKRESKSLFDKINLFNKNHESSDDDFDSYEEDELDRELSKFFNNEKSNGKSDDYDDYEDDFEYIAPIKPKEPKSNNKRQHKFRSSEDLDGFEDLEDLTKESVNKSDSMSSPKKSGSKSSSKKKSKSESSSSKKKSKSNSKKKSTSDKESKSKAKEEPEEIEYEDFTDDFFDDGVFGEEGYEALLDDYVEPKKKSKKTSKKASSKSANKSDKSKDDEPYYDFEGKGADSVFNLDD